MRYFLRTGIYLIAVISLILAGGLEAGAQEGTIDDCSDDKSVINVIFENDLFGNGTDRHFTHGTRLSYVSRNLGSKCHPHLGSDEERDLGFFEEKWHGFRDLMQDKVPRLMGMDNRFSLILGQNMFTPENISRRTLIPNDRPYAGWLYVGAGYIRDLKKNETDEEPYAFDNFEIDIGLIGPASLAGDLQEGWHDVIGATDPQGWDNQLENEVGVVLTYERKWRLIRPQKKMDDGLDFDFMPHLGVALGNVYTYGAIGGTLRVGMHLEADYGPPRIRPGVQGSDFFSEPKGTFGWYIFGGVEGRAVGRNVFLDGSTFQSSHSVDKHALVGDFQAGLVVTFKSFRLAFTNIFRTDEFVGQNEADEFGSVSASFRF